MRESTSIAASQTSPPATPRVSRAKHGSSTAGEGRAGIKGERRVPDLVGARGLSSGGRRIAGTADSGTASAVASRPLQLCGRGGDCGGAADSGTAGAMTAAGTAGAGNRGRGRTSQMWTPTLTT
jgi:hypothetical protein